MNNLGIDQDNLKKVVEILNQLLADEFSLYVKTLNYHWNVTGPLFDPLHLFFRRQYEDLFEIVDLLAERVRTLLDHPVSSMKEFLSLSRIIEDHTKNKTDQHMIAQLLADHETMIRQLRKDIMTIQDDYKDIGTANLLTDNLLEKQEKIAWMLRSSLIQSPNVLNKNV